jgi:hypothetical protein
VAPAIAPPTLPPGAVPPAALPPVVQTGAFQPAIVPPPVVVAPWEPSHTWTVFGDVLYLHPTGVDMAHAQIQDGARPAGLIGVADPSFDVGFRVGGEMLFAPNDAVFVAYTFFEEGTTSAVGGPADSVLSLVQHQGVPIGTAAGPVTADYEIEFQIGDIAYRRFLVHDAVGAVSVYAGGRFGHLEQRFLQQSANQFIPPNQILHTSTTIEFDGGGPMTGIDAARTIGGSGFSVYGRALVAALTGEFDSHYRMFTPPATRRAEAIWQDDRIVPMLDYELGLAWTSPLGRFRLAAGYLASHWFNAVTTPVFVDAVQANNYVDVSDTISFDGLVGRAEVRW